KPFVPSPRSTARGRPMIASLALPEGRYFLTIAAHSAINEEIYDWQDEAHALDVEVIRDVTRVGQLGLSTEWSTERLAASACAPVAASLQEVSQSSSRL